MNAQDKQSLQDFLDQLVQAHGIQKDTEADAMIQRAVAQQPDAAYLLVQRALLVGRGLDSAKARIAALEDQLRQVQSGQPGGGKFLDADAWGNSGAARPAAQAQGYAREAPAPYQPQAQPPYQPQYQPQYQPPQPPQRTGFFGGGMGGGLGSTLGTVATTAAGVAAGGFLFQGLEHMFNRNEGGGSNHLLNSEDRGNSLFSDQSGSSLADQAGVQDVDSFDNSRSEGLFDSSADNNGPDDGGGFFDGDGSDEGLFS